MGAIFGSGFAVQSNIQAKNESVAATQVLANSTGLHPEQLGVYSTVLSVRAEHKAKDTISGANAVLAAAKGKADTKKLSTDVASLSNYKLLETDLIFKLVDKTSAETAKVKAAAKEADRVAAKKAAEKKAAEKAAAEAAAEQAAADKAAAEAAAQAAAQEQASSSTSAPSRPSAPTDPSGAQALARDMAASNYGWGADQFGCLVSLWNRESGWNVNAYNASSGATGIPQALPGSKMASAGADWATNAATQISWGLGYISGSYGTPCGAWDHSESVGWY